jgi:DNA-directed RNA polymerase subunit RPC12/RpoP
VKSVYDPPQGMALQRVGSPKKLGSVSSDDFHGGDVLIDEPFPYPHCGWSSPEMHIHVVDLSAREGGWSARGHGITDAMCPTCGAIVHGVRKSLPIECAEVGCPDCGLADTLSYKIQEISVRGSSFDFTVNVECRNCGRRKFMRRLVDQLLKIRRLKVGPTSIELERLE